MKYIINLTLVFDVNTRTLTLKNDKHLSIELSKPATRLLCELINNNNTTLIREDIIRTVWIDYGFTPSSASLSNHISELRKAFESLGINKKIIITVPRTGFKMEADILPIIKNEECISKQVGDVIKSGVPTPPVLTYTHVRVRLKNLIFEAIKYKKNIIIFASVLLTIISGITLFTFKKNENTHLITTIGVCNIYDLSNTKPPTDLVANAKSMMKSEGIDCIHSAADIYYTDARPMNNLFKVRFMAVCRYDDTKKYQNCTNYRIVK